VKVLLLVLLVSKFTLLAHELKLEFICSQCSVRSLPPTSSQPASQSQFILPISSLDVNQPQFILQVEISGRAPGRFGQTSSYLFSHGTTPICQFATAFALINNQLYADRHLVSTNGSTPYQPLVASSTASVTPGGISTGFSLVNGVLQWSDPNFASSTATFCLSPSNTVYVVSDPSSTPSGCIPVTLTQIPCKSRKAFDPYMVH
jgi:hypothetical protein